MDKREKLLWKPIKVVCPGNCRTVVEFQEFNDRVVKCWLYDEAYEKMFVTIAKCNVDDGDKFSRQEGERIALEKAFEKRRKFYERTRVLIDEEITMLKELGEEKIKKEFSRRQEKMDEFDK